MRQIKIPWRTPPGERFHGVVSKAVDPLRSVLVAAGRKVDQEIKALRFEALE